MIPTSSMYRHFRLNPFSWTFCKSLKFHEDDGTFLASGLAFGLLFYCVPFALLTTPEVLGMEKPGMFSTKAELGRRKPKRSSRCRQF